MSPSTSELQTAMFGLGCFWGAERKFWTTPGVVNTRVGFSAGETEAPSYREVCSGMTGHNEVVWLQFDPSVVSYEGLLAVFFEAHDPTQGMRQGNDVGSQYRSGIYVYGETQREAAFVVRAQYGAAVAAAGYGAITTEVVSAGVFYEADEGHQRYLEKNPTGYCGLGGIGVECG